MKNRLAIVALCLAALARPAAAELKVVTTTTDLADIAARIAGERASVEALARGFQNPHHVDAKPSLIVRLIDADLFIATGLGLEESWAPALLRGARNRRIFPGAPGYLEAGDVVTPLEVPANPSRAEGDVHPQGNPHFMADPANARPVAEAIANRLAKLDPAGAASYRSNLASFTAELERRIAGWTDRMKPLKGTAFVSYHRDWIYFAARFGLRTAGEIEPKPGIPPTASHTAALIDMMKAQNVGIVIADPWYEARTGAFIARETGATVVELALFPGAMPGTDSYFDAIEHNVTRMLAASRP